MYRRASGGIVAGVVLVGAAAGLTATCEATEHLVINEILASNHSVVADEDGDFEDWIEICNADTVAVDLSGYTLTDDPDETNPWAFPALQLEAGEFLLVWASGKDRTAGGNELHTNFKLNRAGEYVGLYAPCGAAVDSLTFPEQLTDISYGRVPGCSDPFGFFVVPTPAAPNDGGDPPYGSVSIDPADGVYVGNLVLTLATDVSNGEIRYTDDGSPPIVDSQLYTGPLTIDQTRVLRARVFVGGEPRSSIATCTYVVNDEPALPVVSVATHPDNLWDPDTGIMTNWEETGPEWEREAHVSLIENGRGHRFSIPAGIRIHGNWSRRFPKKSLRLYFRSEYGASTLDGRLFPDKSVDRFDRLVLYSGSADQTAGYAQWTLLRDVLTTALLQEAGGVISAFRPVALYLNGEYWGLYWLREYLDEEYLESNFGIDEPDLIDRIDTVREGDAVFWNQTASFFENRDLADPENYATAEQTYLDLDNFIEYHQLQIFVANWDWPHHNNYRFSDREGPRHWRYMLWDADPAWGGTNHRVQVSHNTLAWATRDQLRPDLAGAGEDNDFWLSSTLLLRKLLDNEGFRARFINHFADLLNGTLTPAHVIERIDALASLIGPEIEREVERWRPNHAGRWPINVETLRDFAAERPAFVRQHLAELFGLEGGMATLTIEPPTGAGRVQVGTVFPENLPWTGSYFRDLPINVAALPDSGYAFSGWSDPELPSAPQVTVRLTADRTLSATFVREPAPVLLVLTASGLDGAIRLRWQMRGGAAAIGFGVLRAPGPAPEPSQFRLLNADAMISGAPPWEYVDRDVAPGEIYAYKIRALFIDGRVETSSTILATASPELAPPFALLPVWPNPTRGETAVRFDLPASGEVEVSIYDAHGRCVRRLLDEPMPSGRHFIPWEGRDDRGRRAASGVYLVRVTWQGMSERGRVLLIR